MSLKGGKGRTWQESFAALRAEVRRAWQRLGSPIGELAADLAEDVLACTARGAPPSDVVDALHTLTTALHRLHGRKAWLLIDEYDAPIQSAWLHGYDDQAIDFLRAFLGAGLKDNTDVNRAVLTGILRVAKEGLFSDVNNVVIDTVLDHGFATDFGFTEDEVRELAGDEPAFLSDLRRWYNGYAIGGHAIYNPWSIANALRDRGGGFKAHWMASGGTEVLERIATRFSSGATTAMEALLAGDAAHLEVIEGVAMPEIERSPRMLMNLLLHTG